MSDRASLRNPVNPASLRNPGTIPNETDIYATAALTTAMIRTAAATLSHATENLAGYPAVTEGYLIQQQFLSLRHP